LSQHYQHAAIRWRVSIEFTHTQIDPTYLFNIAIVHEEQKK